jgi:hypothetical protein
MASTTLGTSSVSSAVEKRAVDPRQEEQTQETEWLLQPAHAHPAEWLTPTHAAQKHPAKWFALVTAVVAVLRPTKARLGVVKAISDGWNKRAIELGIVSQS